MNRKEAEELLPIIKAFSEGRIIEFSSITDVSKAWREVTDFPIGMIKNFKFRIKPEPIYRPFANAEECWQEMMKHQPFGWVKRKENEHYSLITDVDDIRYGISLNERSGFDMNYVWVNYIFADGLPFGVKVEE